MLAAGELTLADSRSRGLEKNIGEFNLLNMAEGSPFSGY